MSVELIRQWYSNIPEMERDLPVLMVDGNVYTPREIYNEVMKGTELGKKMQEKIEKLRSPHSFYYSDLRELREVAYERIKRIVQDLPEGFSIVSVGGRIITDKEGIYEALKDSAVEIEMKKILDILRR